MEPSEIGPFIRKTDIVTVPIEFLCKAMLSSINVFNRLDVKDNFGNNIAPALEVLLEKCSQSKLNYYRPFNLFYELSAICKKYILEANGVLLYVFFSSASQAFTKYSRHTPIEAYMWVEALNIGLNSVRAQTRSEESEWTCLNVLSPFIQVLVNWKTEEENDVIGVLGKALEAAQKAVEDSIHIESSVKKPGLPEVSMQATLAALTAIVEGIRYVMV